jgi:uncharacterized protein YjiS (DUF1127 family)
MRQRGRDQIPRKKKSMFYDTSASHDWLPRLLNLMAAALTPWQLLGKRLTERKAYKDLSGFDDHMLKDIGISRGGIRSAIREGRDRGLAASTSQPLTQPTQRRKT